jgi:hypothetical protein
MITSWYNDVSDQHQSGQWNLTFRLPFNSGAACFIACQYLPTASNTKSKSFCHFSDMPLSASAFRHATAFASTRVKFQWSFISIARDAYAVYTVRQRPRPSILSHSVRESEVTPSEVQASADSEAWTLACERLCAQPLRLRLAPSTCLGMRDDLAC